MGLYQTSFSRYLGLRWRIMAGRLLRIRVIVTPVSCVNNYHLRGDEALWGSQAVYQRYAYASSAHDEAANLFLVSALISLLNGTSTLHELLGRRLQRNHNSFGPRTK